MEEERQCHNVVTYNLNPGKDSSLRSTMAELKLEIRDASWAAPTTLSKISLNLRYLELVTIIGPVGSGKVNQFLVQKSLLSSKHYPVVSIFVFIFSKTCYLYV